jgi:hypothetical protein
MSQLASIVPIAPLTDDVFPFNQEAFTEINRYQKEDLAYLDTPPIQALIGVGDVVGGTTSAVIGGAGGAAAGVASSLSGGVTTGLPGGGLLQQAGQGTLGAISTTTVVADQLVDPTKVAREHYYYSNEINKALPGAIDAVDKVIHDFSYTAGNGVQDLYGNTATHGVQIITGLLGTLADVDSALAKLIEVITKNNTQENISVGQDKYNAVPQLSNLKNYLQEHSELLPEVLKTIGEVKAAFATIAENFTLAKGKIVSGVTDPNHIFAEKQEVVISAWQNFEVKRKTMTYLPYKY